MSRFVRGVENVILQRIVLSIVEHQQSLNCCKSLILVILIDVRVLLKLLSFFTRNLLLEHVLSADLQHFPAYSTSDLCQLLNSHRLHLQVFCSAHIVCTSKCFALRSLVFQQVFRVQRFNATFRNRLGR